MKRVIVGMSGGVDSAAAAYLLKAMGYDVIGVTLRTWMPDGRTESRCCEIGEAQKTADLLNIPYYVRSYAAPFYAEIAKPFFESYLAGETPNPCVFCNPQIKWDGLLAAAASLHADYAATGHYARIAEMPGGRLAVQSAHFPEKDQSYMLCRLTQAQLRHTLFPLGNLSKPEVRRIAEQVGIPAAKRPDSQEICFVSDQSYADLIERECAQNIPECGDFLDLSGQVIGRHSGIHRYTVGQRRGLGIACGTPRYVIRISAADNTVTLGPESALYTSDVRCSRLHFMGLSAEDFPEKLRCFGKIRYRHRPQSASVSVSGDRLTARFDSPVRAPAAGQSAVFSDALGRILVSGIICPPTL